MVGREVQGERGERGEREGEGRRGQNGKTQKLGKPWARVPLLRRLCSPDWQSLLESGCKGDALRYAGLSARGLDALRNT